ncbi:MAG: S8 family serine peptidase [Lachnospiraceae bacterium]|nr:S8 family serine peptidase [Lachnospiraceae bacterium]
MHDYIEAGKIVVTLNCYYYPNLLEGNAYEKVDIIFQCDNNKIDIILITLIDKNKEMVYQEIEKLLTNHNVVFAEPAYLCESYLIPNDPEYRFLWGLNKIEAPSAWDYTTGDTNVVVGVVDSGIDYTHLDIKDNLWVSQNGFFGWNFADNNSDSIDRTGHGTHVAGTIGAVGNNAIGITGVCWNIKVASLKIGNHAFSIAAGIAAIDYANKNNISILNNSWGGRDYSNSLKYAIGQYKGIFVASVGNNGLNNDYYPDYPASYDCENIISVAASDQNNELTSFSNFGAVSVDIAAPGTNILSLTLNNGYDYSRGTSMAAPHVAGAAALLKSYLPDLTIANIKNIILSSVDRNTNLSGKILTGGVLNVNRMISMARAENL